MSKFSLIMMVLGLVGLALMLATGAKVVGLVLMIVGLVGLGFTRLGGSGWGADL
jgi:hypothetical protein